MIVNDDSEGLKPPELLPADERRVLGVLIEKSLTTPDAYPMTLNGIVNGCSQKSNRLPVAAYSEVRVDAAVDGLREKQLVNEVHTSGGRTEKFRHVARIRFGWGEVHVAVMGELLLRGRQSIGDLRSRAARMRPIESLDILRDALEELMGAGYVRASGPLARRGVEVDHGLYDGDAPAIGSDSVLGESGGGPPRVGDVASAATNSGVAAPTQGGPSAQGLAEELKTLRGEVRDLRSEVERLKASLGE